MNFFDLGVLAAKKYSQNKGNISRLGQILNKYRAVQPQNVALAYSEPMGMQEVAYNEPSVQPFEGAANTNNPNGFAVGDLGNRFINNLGVGIAGTGRVFQQGAGGLWNAVESGVQGVQQGVDQAREAFAPPTGDPYHDSIAGRFGNLTGGITKGVSEAAWLAPNAVIAPLANIDETKPAGQLLGALPNYLKEQVGNLYGTSGQPGAFQQAGSALGVPQELTDPMAQLAQNATPNIAEYGGRVAIAKGMGAVQRGMKGAIKPSSPYSTPRMTVADALAVAKNVDDFKAVISLVPDVAQAMDRMGVKTPAQVEQFYSYNSVAKPANTSIPNTNNINSPIFDLESSSQKGLLPEELNPPSVMPKPTGVARVSNEFSRGDELPGRSRSLSGNNPSENMPVAMGEIKSSNNKFTPVDVINDGYRNIKAKEGVKFAQKYFKNVDKLFDPNSNKIIEYRPNGVVTLENGKYIFTALTGVNDWKVWEKGFKTDVSDQFTNK